MPPLVNTWYMDTVSIDVSHILLQVIPSKECGYPYSFDVALLETDSEGNEVAGALPVEIQFNYDTEAGYLGFEIGKCDPIGTNDPFDEECNDGSIPYEKKWTIRMVIGIVQPKGEAFGYVDAPVFIDNPCLRDEVRMEALTPAPIDYILKYEPYCATYELQVSQKYALCPLECQIKDPNSSAVPIFVKTFTEVPIAIQPGENPSIEEQTAVVQIESGDKLLDQAGVPLEVTCASTSSSHPNRAAVDNFQVKFRDECYDAVITPAIVPDFEGDLYTLIEQPFVQYGGLDLLGCPEIFYILDGPIASDAIVDA